MSVQNHCCRSHHFVGCADGGPGCCPNCPTNPTRGKRRTNNDCRCTFDPAYHREFNQARSGEPIDRCFNPADPDTGLCTPCLFGCAP